MRILLITTIVAAVIAGCGGNGEEAGADVQDTPEASAEGIVGTWEVVEVVEGTDMGNIGTYYTYNEDGTMKSGSATMSIEGTWEISGDTLKQEIGGVTLDVIHSLNGNEMVYDIINGEQTFRLRRQ
ncbi:MAG: hypothetical protein GF388_00645 [Candidatus Aegiribacteria sp.]|nr:hypothetical protein [Candidatus Aegiribacteria sp.]MBD3293939.1 hypothetical protein [Candidatus Fermentibacteria bacterium]